jgi:uncharacterized protein (TIGR02246 family)
MATEKPQTVAPSITEFDDHAIRAVVAQAIEAQNDPESLLALHHADAVIVNFGGRRVLGREAFGEAMRAALTTPSVAIVSAIKTVHDGRPNQDGSPLPASAGALTYVVVRGDDGWQIALAQTTPILA